MAGPCRSFVSGWPGTGIARWRDAAKRAGSRGNGCDGWSISGCLPHAYAILIPYAAWASSPEAGAQCGSSARWDLCGGLPERAVPTATRKGFCFGDPPRIRRPTNSAGEPSFIESGLQTWGTSFSFWASPRLNTCATHPFSSRGSVWLPTLADKPVAPAAPNVWINIGVTDQRNGTV